MAAAGKTKAEVKDEKGAKPAADAKPKRERKVYDMPGQTKELDPNGVESESLRIFYTTLREQRPESEIAPLWLMQHGLLPREEAEKLHAKVQSSRAAARGGSSSAARSRSPSKPRVRKPDPRRGKGRKTAADAKGKGKAGAKAGAKPKAGDKRARSTAKPRAKPAAKKAPAVIDDDDSDDDDDDFAKKPAAKKPAPSKAGAGKKFVGKTAIIDDDDDDDFD